MDGLGFRRTNTRCSLDRWYFGQISGHSRHTQNWRYSVVGTTNRICSPPGAWRSGEKIEYTKINITVKPEYPWTIIIIGGETGRQMVQTMQITVVACGPPCSKLLHTFIRLRTLVRAHVQSAAISGFEAITVEAGSLRWWRVPGYTVLHWHAISNQSKHIYHHHHLSFFFSCSSGHRLIQS